MFAVCDDGSTQVLLSRVQEMVLFGSLLEAASVAMSGMERGECVIIAVELLRRGNSYADSLKNGKTHHVDSSGPCPTSRYKWHVNGQECWDRGYPVELRG